MSLLPNDDVNLAEITYEDVIFPSLTYHVELENNRIRGKTDEAEAMKQVIYCILHTERFQYPIYYDSYGNELYTVIGMPMSYAIPEIERCIKEALTWDSRIDSVDNFQHEIDHGTVHTTFIVHTIYGDVDSETEVTV